MTRFSKRLRLLTFAFGLLTLTGIVVAASVFTDLGVSEDDARSIMFDNLTSGGFYFPGDKAAFKSASGQARAAMVQAVATFGKAYAQSDVFKQRVRGLPRGQPADAADAQDGRRRGGQDQEGHRGRHRRTRRRPSSRCRPISRSRCRTSSPR